MKRMGTDVNNDIVLFTLAARRVGCERRNCADLIAVHAWRMPRARASASREKRELVSLVIRDFLATLPSRNNVGG